MIDNMLKATKVEQAEEIYNDADTVAKVALHAVETKDWELYEMACDALTQVTAPLDALDEAINPDGAA